MKTSRILLAICAVLLTASCSAVTDPGRFTFDGAGGGCPEGDVSDLDITLVNFEAYADEQIEFRVVELPDPMMPGDTEEVVLRGILEGLDEEGVSVDGGDNAARLCLSFPELVEEYGDLQVRTFVDLNFDGAYDALTEPGWQDSVTDSLAIVDATETETGFDDPPPPPGNFELAVTGMAPHTAGAQHVAAMVIDSTTGVPVAFWRIADLDDPDFTIFIQEILQPDRDYILEFYADFIQNGVYDPITETEHDHAWLETYRSDGDGDLVEAFAHNLDFDELSYF